jgi:2-polyprenyl-3-methyl-5-hydroxy-6-metoxy-1,4-benzoquinol methylase
MLAADLGLPCWVRSNRWTGCKAVAFGGKIKLRLRSNIGQQKTLVSHLDDVAGSDVDRAKEFFRYYNAKRARHQHMQVSMLETAAIEGLKNLTEIGSLYGYATGLFQSAGFSVTTIDVKQNILGELVTKHITKNILDINENDLKGSDVIVCCETLEHIPWEQAVDRLSLFHRSNSKYLLISVPYRSPHLILNIEWAHLHATFKFAVKKLTSRWKTFRAAPEEWGHQWEIGYKGYPLVRLERALEKAGWTIVKRKHEVPSGSILILSLSRRSHVLS